MRLEKRIEKLEADEPGLNESFSCVHIYNPENKEILKTHKIQIPANGESVAIYLPDNGR